MPTVSQALIRRNSRAQRSPKVPHKRPRVPRVAELFSKSNEGDNSPSVRRETKSKHKGEKPKRAMSAETTRETLDCWPSSEQLHDTVNDEEDDDDNKLFQCIFSDGSKRVLTLAQLNFLQLHGTLPTERSGPATVDLGSSIENQQRQMIESNSNFDLKELQRQASDQIQASQHEVASKIVHRVAPSTIQQYEYPNYSICPSYHQVGRTTLSPQLTKEGELEYHSEYRTSADLQKQVSSPPKMSPQQSQIYDEQQYYQNQYEQQLKSYLIAQEQQKHAQQSYQHHGPPEAQQGQYGKQALNYNITQTAMSQPPTIATVPSENGYSVQTMPTSTVVSHHSLQEQSLPQSLEWINNMSYLTRCNNTITSRPEQDNAALHRISVMPELSRFPEPPKDPTDPKELKQYHRNVDTFLQSQNNSLYKAAVMPPQYPPRAAVLNNTINKRIPGGVAGQHTVTKDTQLPASSPAQPGLLRNLLNRLSGDLAKKAGCRTILGCLSSTS